MDRSLTQKNFKVQSFKIMSPLQNEKRSFCDFLVNINTSANMAPPFYSHVAIAVETDFKIFAVKTQTTIAILKFQNRKIQLQQQIEIEGFQKNSLSVFEFCFLKDNKNQLNPYLLVGYRSGLIELLEYQSKKVINRLNWDFNYKNPIKRKCVQKIVQIPNQQGEILGKLLFSFEVLFADSCAIQYNYEKQTTNNQYFIEKLDKFEKKISFNPSENKFIQSIKNDLQSEFRYCQYDPKLKMDYFSAHNFSLETPNPSNYFQFNCKTVTDLQLIQHSFLTDNFQDTQIKGNQIFLAFTGFDGYFRFYNFQTMKPILSIKNDFGGYQSLTFSDNCQLLGLSSQDDSLIIFDLKNLTHFKIIGHSSFVTKCAFDTQISDVIRVYTTSLDSHLSVTDFLMNVFENQDSLNLTQPIFIKIQDNQKQITSNYTIKVNKEGLGFLTISKDLLLIQALDGCVSAFIIQDVNKDKHNNISHTNHDQYINQEQSTNYDNNRQQLNQIEDNIQGQINQYQEHNQEFVNSI